MGKARIRPVKMTDEDWQTIGRLAKVAGLSRAKWILEACKAKAAECGVVIQGTAPHGRKKQD